jgi:hypothetical protein
LFLQAMKSGIGDDRLFLDEISLQRGEDLLIRDIHRMDHRKAVEFEVLGRQELHPDPQIRQIGAEILLRLVRQWREVADRSHVYEPAINIQLKVAGEIGFRVLPGADERILECEGDTIKLLHDGEVGSQQFAREKEISIELHRPIEGAILSPEPSVERRRRIEALE